MTKGQKPHKHYWHHEQAVYNGSKGQTLVHRYCECGVRQWGRVTSWRKMSKSDAACRDEEAKREQR